MRFYALAISLPLALASTPASSNGTFYSGNELKERCDTNKTFCGAYIAGVIDHLMMDQLVEGAEHGSASRPGSPSTK